MGTLGAGPPAVLRVPAAALRAIGKQDARRFAAQFTADYLSWDEDHPQWRSDTLRRYIDTTPDDTASAMRCSGGAAAAAARLTW